MIDFPFVADLADTTPVIQVLAPASNPAHNSPVWPTALPGDPTPPPDWVALEVTPDVTPGFTPDSPPDSPPELTQTDRPQPLSYRAADLLDPGDSDSSVVTISNPVSEAVVPAFHATPVLNPAEFSPQTLVPGVPVTAANNPAPRTAPTVTANAVVTANTKNLTLDNPGQNAKLLAQGSDRRPSPPLDRLLPQSFPANPDDPERPSNFGDGVRDALDAAPSLDSPVDLPVNSPVDLPVNSPVDLPVNLPQTPTPPLQLETLEGCAAVVETLGQGVSQGLGTIAAPGRNPGSLGPSVDRNLDASLDASIVQTSDPCPQPSPPDCPIDGIALGEVQPDGCPTETATTPTASDLTSDEMGVVNLSADRQNLDQERQIVTADGNAFLRFNGGAVQADRIQYNISTKFIRAEGDVRFARGQQRIEGEYLEYNLMQQRGIIEPATGQLFNRESPLDLNLNQAPSTPLPSDDPAIVFPDSPPLVRTQKVGETVISTGFGTSFGTTESTNGNPENEVSLPLQVNAFSQTGTVNHWRYTTEHLELIPDGWNADQVRLSNDPFSPSQFQLRANRAQYRELGPLVSEIRADRPRYIFDNGLSLPTFRNRVLIDRRPQDSGLFSIGYDGNDRGGLFIERSFEPISRDNIRLNLTPQLLVQKALLNSDTDVDPDNSIGGLSALALRGSLSAQLRPGTSLNGSFVATDLGAIGDDKFDETIRANLRLQQALPWQHTLAFESSFRDRLFNGSLGYQTVHRNNGLIVYSPTFNLGQSGVTLRYQGSLQFINADSDRPDLLNPIRDNNRVDLTRYQGSATLGRGVTLWRGEPLPATPTLGLRYTPSPITPQVNLYLSATGIYSGYSNGETQQSLTTSVGISGTFGHHSRRWFDYTQVNATYSRALRSGESPFLFDRIGDSQALGLGLVQQIYGPIVIGLQTGLNLDTGEEFSRDYSVEYHRRAFNVALRYNPEREIGTLTFRIHDFAWQGQPRGKL